MCRKPTFRNRALAIAAVLTVGGIALFFNLYEPWMRIGPDRVIDNGFERPGCTAEWTGWNSDLTHLRPEGGYRKSGGVELQAGPGRHGVLRMTIFETEDIPAFRIGVRAKADRVAPGEQSYHVPRTIFFFRDQQGHVDYSRSHTVFNFKKDSGWKRFSALFPVPADIIDARLQVQNLGVGGTLTIDDISVIPVAPRPSAPLFHIIFILLWIGVFSACLLALSPWKSRTGTAALLCALAIILGVLLPGDFLDDTIVQTKTLLKERVHRRIPRPPESTQIAPAAKQPHPQTKEPAVHKSNPETEPQVHSFVQQIHTTGHFALFMLLAILSLSTWTDPRSPRRTARNVLGGLLLFAVSTEVMQFLTPDRKAGFHDLFIDLTGIFIATLLFEILTLPRLKHLQNIHRKKNPSARR